jgi:hypothetical protein
MLLKKLKYRRYDGGGAVNYLNSVSSSQQSNQSATNYLKSLDTSKVSKDGMTSTGGTVDSTLEGASALPMIGQWIQMAQMTGDLGNQISGDGSNQTKNYIGNLVDTDNLTKIANSQSMEEFLDNTFTFGLFGTTAKREKKEYDAKKNEQDRQNLIKQLEYSNANLRNYDQNGSNLNNVYARYGGTLLPLKKFAIGGNLEELSENNVLVNGRSHEQGGVKFPESGVEMEGGETINNSGPVPFAFSEKLGFADKHRKIAKQMSKVESRPYNSISAATLKHLKGKEEQLKVDQEMLKQLMGIK